jgi:archaellum biogenesis protein FlaJ (TadC family)
MADGIHQDWRELCLAVTNERDSPRLRSLLQRLIEALDAGDEAGVTPPSA